MRGAIATCSVLAVLLLGCSSADQSSSVVVMAAASLTDAFSQIEAAFEAENPDVDVQLNLAGSATLREQILQGAPADVFAPANANIMARILSEGEVQRPIDFATNTLVVAVPAENPGNVTSVTDLADSNLFVGLCSEGVPCGDFARTLLESADVTASVDTNESDVRALLTKIEAGELDAGIVYATDAASTDDVVALPIDAAFQPAITYPIAALRSSPNPTDAAAFVAFVQSPAGQAILASHGFGTP